MKHYTGDYLTKEFQFPTEYNPKSKGLKHCINYAAAIYSLHVKNKTGIPYSAQSTDYYRLRLYGSGDQPEEIYKRYWLGESSSDNISLATPLTSVDGEGGWTSSQTPSAKRKSYTNLLWKVISIAPKIKAALIGKFQRAEFDVVANAIDMNSGAEAESKKYSLWFQKENADFLNEFYEKAGLDQEQHDYVPESLQELDLFEARGGFKPEYAKEIEKVIAHTFKLSRFDGIKDNMMADAIDIGVYGSQEYYDDEDKKYKYKYIDPEYAVIQYSKYNDFRDSQFAGHIEQVTVGEVRSRLNNQGIKFEEKDLAGIAKKYSGYLANPVTGDFNKYATQLEADGNTGSGKTYGYDFFKINVFHAEWIETDGKQQLIHKNKTGNKKVINQEYGKKNKENDYNTTKKTYDKFKYGCSWVVGSDSLAYDFGKRYDILRPEKNIALTYHFYKLPAKSITDQLIPLYDNFMNLFLKYQGALASAVPKGYLINVTSISNVTAGKTDGGGKEEEHLTRFIQSGFMFFKETNAMSTRNSTMKPIYDLPGGMGPIFAEIREGFQLNIRMVEQLTGVSPLSLGTVDPNAPVGTSELSYQNTQDTLRPILTGYSTIKEGLARNTAYWITLKIENKEIAKSYEPVIGANGVKVIQIADGNGVKYGITLEAQATEIERKEIYESAKQALNSGRNGQPGINESDFFAILQIITSNGSLKHAEDVLQNRIAKNRKEMAAEARETIQQQQDNALSLEEQKTRSAAAMINIQLMADVKLEYAKAVLDVMVKSPDTQMKNRELAELKMNFDMIMAEHDRQNQQPQQQQQQQQQPTV